MTKKINLAKLVADLANPRDYTSSPDAGHGESGIVIHHDPVGGGLIVYNSTDTYDPTLATGTYRFLLGLDGSVSIVNAGITISGSGGHIALGNPPPTSATTGTGIWIDYTGIYGLASNVQQAYMSATAGKILAGAGTVTLDADGIKINQATDNTNRINFYNNATLIGEMGVYSNVGATEVTGTWNLKSNSNNTDAQMRLNARDRDDSVISQIWLDASGAAGTGYAALFGTAFAGVMVGDFNAPSSLLHLKSTAPTFRMEDSTSSAKSLLLTVDANKAIFEEAGGTDIMILDLTNARVGVKNASPSVELDVTGAGAFSGAVTVTGALTINGANSFGYVTGAGGAVTQNTNKSTGVTLNTPCGTITMNNATLNAATTVSFTLTNSTITTSDVLVLNHLSGGTAGAYLLNAQCASGSASINVRNITAGNLGEAIVLSFAVVRVATS